MLSSVDLDRKTRGRRGGVLCPRSNGRKKSAGPAICPLPAVRYTAAVPSPVRDNTARFELDAEGHIAVANYRLSPGVIAFTHTEVPPQLRERGIGSRLVRGALEQARAQGLKVVPRCAFVRHYIAAHPEFQDLLA